MGKLIFIWFCTLFVSCSNESDTDTVPVLDIENLVGVWAIALGPSDGNLEQLITYEFRTDGTMEVQTVFQTVQGAKLGFRYRAKGTYAISGDDLLMSRERIYILEDENVEFVESLEELILSGEQWDETVRAAISPTGRLLTFDYGPCNDTFNCVGTLEFSRTD